jgi:hypothetical protein
MSQTSDKGYLPGIEPDTVTLNFKTLYLGILITAIIIGIILLFDKIANLNVKFSDYLSVFSGGIITTALIYNAMAISLTRATNKERLEFDRKNIDRQLAFQQQVQLNNKIELTYRISSEWFKPGIADHVERSRRFLQPYKNKLADRTELMKFKTQLEEPGHLENRKALICILNYFENMALLIKRNVIDEEALKEAFKTVFCDYYKSLKPYIEDHQTVSSRYLMN